jgi:hypothetical protein
MSRPTLCAPCEGVSTQGTPLRRRLAGAAISRERRVVRPMGDALTWYGVGFACGVAVAASVAAWLSERHR